MSSPAPNSDRTLGFILNDISRLARKEFDRRVRSLGLTRAQWMFLYYLARQPGSSQSDLAETLQMERISVSRQAQRLERMGWIERAEHRDDARAYRLRLTPKAQRVASRLETIAAQLREEYMHDIPPRRREALIDDLLRVKCALLRMDAHAKLRPDEN